MKPLRVALYSRVSTDRQSIDNQQIELRQIASDHGWNVVAEFVDEGISGAKGRDQRPALDALLTDVARKRFDLIACWSVDRLGRSLQDLLAFLSELHAKKVNLYLHQQGMDTTTPAGKAMFQMLGVFAEFERAIIQERVKAGLERAKQQGKRLGRPTVRPEVEEKIRALRAQGMGVLKVARTLGVGVSVVQRVAKQDKTP